jgi:hypothetical protein
MFIILCYQLVFSLVQGPVHWAQVHSFSVCGGTTLVDWGSSSAHKNNFLLEFSRPPLWNGEIL